MSERNIPAKQILACDRCGAEGEYLRSGAFKDGGLHAKSVERCSRAYDVAAGGAFIRLDLCAACDMEFSKWLDRN